MAAQVPVPAPHVNAAPAIVRTACPGGGAHDVCGFVRVPLDRSAARRPHDPDLLRAPVAHRALAAAGRDRALDRGRARASRRPPTARRGSSSGGRSPRAATCSSSTCAAPAARSRSTVRRSGGTSSATSTAPPAALRSSGRHATPTTRPNRCRIWPRCCARSASGASTCTAIPTARTRPRRSRSATRGSCARSCSTATYQLPGSDPALADLAASTRSALRLACGRRPGCPAARTDPVRVVAGLVARVRRDPIVGTAPDGDGTPTHVRVDEDALVQVLMSGFYDQAVWRDILAAARSARRRRHAAAAPARRRDGHHRRAERRPAALLGVALPGGHLPRLSRALGARRRRSPSAPPRCARRSPTTPPGRSRRSRRRRGRAPTSRARLPACKLAVAREARPARAAVGRLSPGADAHPERRPRQHHAARRRDRRRPPLPAKHARRRRERRPRDGAPRPERLRLGHLPALRRRPARRATRRARIARRRCASCLRSRARRPAVAPARAGRRDASTLLDRRIAAAAAETVADALQRWWVNYDGTGVGLRGGRWSYSGREPDDVHVPPRGVRAGRRGVRDGALDVHDRPRPRGASSSAAAAPWNICGCAGRSRPGPRWPTSTGTRPAGRCTRTCSPPDATTGSDPVVARRETLASGTAVSSPAGAGTTARPRLSAGC